MVGEELEPVRVREVLEEGGGEVKENPGEVLDFSQWYLVLNNMGGYGEEDF